MTSHSARFTHTKGKVTVECTGCGFRRPPAKYLDPQDVFDRHLPKAQAIDLQQHFAARRGV